MNNFQKPRHITAAEYIRTIRDVYNLRKRMWRHITPAEYIRTIRNVYAINPSQKIHASGAPVTRSQSGPESWSGSIFDLLDTRDKLYGFWTAQTREYKIDPFHTVLLGLALRKVEPNMANAIIPLYQSRLKHLPQRLRSSDNKWINYYNWFTHRDGAADEKNIVELIQLMIVINTNLQILIENKQVTDEAAIRSKIYDAMRQIYNVENHPVRQTSTAVTTNCRMKTSGASTTTTDDWTMSNYFAFTTEQELQKQWNAESAMFRDFPLHQILFDALYEKLQNHKTWDEFYDSIDAMFHAERTFCGEVLKIMPDSTDPDDIQFMNLARDYLIPDDSLVPVIVDNVILHSIVAHLDIAVMSVQDQINKINTPWHIHDPDFDNAMKEIQKCLTVGTLKPGAAHVAVDLHSGARAIVLNSDPLNLDYHLFVEVDEEDGSFTVDNSEPGFVYYEFASCITPSELETNYGEAEQVLYLTSVPAKFYEILNIFDRFEDVDEDSKSFVHQKLSLFIEELKQEQHDVIIWVRSPEIQSRYKGNGDSDWQMVYQKKFKFHVKTFITFDTFDNTIDYVYSSMLELLQDLLRHDLKSAVDFDDLITLTNCEWLPLWEGYKYKRLLGTVMSFIVAVPELLYYIAKKYGADDKLRDIVVRYSQYSDIKTQCEIGNIDVFKKSTNDFWLELCEFVLITCYEDNNRISESMLKSYMVADTRTFLTVLDLLIKDLEDLDIKLCLFVDGHSTCVKFGGDLRNTNGIQVYFDSIYSIRVVKYALDIRQRQWKNEFVKSFIFSRFKETYGIEYDTTLPRMALWTQPILWYYFLEDMDRMGLRYNEAAAKWWISHVTNESGSGPLGNYRLEAICEEVF